MTRAEKIIVFENEIEARLLSDILTERKIPHLLRSYYDAAYDGLFQLQSGWGHLEAPEEWKNEILKIYSDIKGK